MSDRGKEILVFPRCQDQLQCPPEPPVQKAGRILKSHLVKGTRIRRATDILRGPRWHSG